ncbi:MAG: hypothetical protein IPK69_11355 [Phycisphaerales bacterium]|nr:MAG: hypothetical protein IPK69_11355 [Phycisphaerales bacterium]
MSSDPPTPDTSGAPPGIKVQLNPSPTGCATRRGGAFPLACRLTDTRPAAIRVPADQDHLLFTQVYLGDAPLEHPTHIAWRDTDAEHPPMIWVDSNANADLTDDPPIVLTREEYLGQAGETLIKFTCTAPVTIPYTNGVRTPGSVMLTRWDDRDAARAPFKGSLFVIGDFGMAGEIRFAPDGPEVVALLFDETGRGDYRGDVNGNDSSIRLLLDLNGDGAFSKRGEIFDPHQPFNVGGVVYQAQDMVADGSTFMLAHSYAWVREIALPPDVRPGATARPFTLDMADGTTRRFPEDFADHLVLVHVYRLSYRPSMELAEGVNRARVAIGESTPIGANRRVIEYIGVSADALVIPVVDGLVGPPAPDAWCEATRSAMAGEWERAGLIWPQALDAMRASEFVETYHVGSSNPLIYLLDAKTGKIVNSGRALQADSIETTLWQALETR